MTPQPPESDLTHPSWELVDPTPDIYALFKEFDRRFFNEALLDRCELKWSNRMTMCAGICAYRGTTRYGLCTISLSQKLLKLRPRSDLVETLLHEMIHAYVFITHGVALRDGHDGHGPRFQEHMIRINMAANTNITVYHSFHNEVRFYKQHVWRCNGSCRSQAPFYGYVKRSMNRAPGQNDYWFRAHQTSCGGVFEKIASPSQQDGKAVGRKRPNNESATSGGSPQSKSAKPLPQKNTIDRYFTGIGQAVGSAGPSTQRTSDRPATSSGTQSKPAVVKKSKSPKKSSSPQENTIDRYFTGTGQSTRSSGNSTQNGESSGADNVRDTLRAHWGKIQPTGNAPSTSSATDARRDKHVMEPHRTAIIIITIDDEDADEF